MKQYVFLPIALVATLAMLLLSSCTITTGSQNDIVDQGEIIKETRKLDTFSSIIASGSKDIEFIISDSSYIEIEAGKNILPHIKTEVNNGQLIIQLDKVGGQPFYSKETKTFHFQTSNSILSDAQIKIKVFGPSLEEIFTSGSINFVADSLSTTEEFKIHTAGKADIDIKHVTCNYSRIEIAGKSNVKIGNLTCQNLRIETAGKGDVKLNVNGADNTDINVAGKSDADITFNNCNRAGIHVAGLANITLRGKLNILDKHIAGHCTLDTDELSLTNKNEE